MDEPLVTKYKVVYEIQAEIARMRSLVLYYENAILRKELAIIEILTNQADIKKEEEKEIEHSITNGEATGIWTETSVKVREKSSREIIEELLPSIGETEIFSYDTLRAKLGTSPKYMSKNWLFNGVSLCMRRGLIFKVQDGFCRTKLNY